MLSKRILCASAGLRVANTRGQWGTMGTKGSVTNHVPKSFASPFQYESRLIGPSVENARDTHFANQLPHQRDFLKLFLFYQQSIFLCVNTIVNSGRSIYPTKSTLCSTTKGLRSGIRAPVPVILLSKQHIHSRQERQLCSDTLTAHFGLIVY